MDGVEQLGRRLSLDSGATRRIRIGRRKQIVSTEMCGRACYLWLQSKNEMC